MRVGDISDAKQPESENHRIMKLCVRIATLVLAMLLILITAFNFACFVKGRRTGEQCPLIFGYGSAVVLSGSMEPEISAGDFLIISEQEAYEVGDVVVYQDGNMAIAHRIVSISPNEIITRGDANNVEDDPITPRQIRGAVVLVVPRVGFAVNALKTPMGTVCILALLALALICPFDFKKSKKKQELDAIKKEIEKYKQDK